MQSAVAALAAVALVAPLAPAQGATARDRRPEWTREEQFLVESVRAADADRHLARLTTDPHVAGTPAGHRTADYVAAELRDAGFEVELERYHVLLSSPTELRLTVTGPGPRQDLDLRERPADVDDDSSDPIVPAFNAYSPSATVEAAVVYAHYGRAEDFEWLASQDVDVAGKICLIRYGKTFRGLKVYEAERRGAVGVVLYSDPDDDGYRKGDPWPNGRYRPATGVQRGSILYLSHLCGDPLTPGRPAHADAERLDRDACSWLPTIPCLPIGWRNAQAILASLGGRNVPGDWQGGCPVTYHTGPGATTVELHVRCDESIREIVNVIGRLRTASTAREYVMIGNHRDAWGHGAIDPGSGSAVSLTAAKALGALVRDGWEPRFEIRYASWDGEEFGLLGSTEHCEDHADDIRRHCLAYFNCDGAVSGPRFSASATPDLVRLLADAAARTPAFDGRGRLLTRWAHGGTRPPVGNLGSGSDYTAFVCWLGVPALDFGSGGGHGVYHSLHDTHFTMSTFIDPDFAIHESMARFLALATLRFTSADVPPVEPRAYGPWLEAAARNLRLPEAERTRLDEAIARFATATKDEDGDRDEGPTLAQLEGMRGVFLGEGIPSRPWYRNVTVAPHIRLGYGAVALPAVTEAIEVGDAGEIARAVGELVATIDAATAVLEDAR